MFTRVLSCCALALGLAMSPAIAATSPAGPASSAFALHRGHHGLRLPKELKMIWKREEHAQMKALPKAQRHGWLKQKWAGMTDQQRQVKIADLQAKWNALPATARQNLLERMRQKQEAHRMKKMERRASDESSTSSPPHQ